MMNVTLHRVLLKRPSDGGEISFKTDGQTLDKSFCSIHQNEITPGDYLRIRIEDNGKGIPKEMQRHIFEPFFSTKDMAENVGMGLAAVYGTVKSHNGVIDVASEVGSGTTMSIYLPLAEKENKREPENIPHDREPLPESPQILLVDDEEMFAEMALDMLSALGYTVTLCRNGREAVELYKKSHREIVLVLLDIVMPEMDGKETYRALKEINPHIKVLVSSGYSITCKAREILGEGAHGFIQKPYRKAELAEKINKILTQ